MISCSSLAGKTAGVKASRPPRSIPRTLLLYCVSISLAGLALAVWAAPGDDKADGGGSRAAEARIGGDIEFLASDALEGRGVGTPGIARAAEHIRTEFQRLGLTSAVEDGSYYQHFNIRLGEKVVAEQTHFTLQGPEGVILDGKLGEQFQPQASGGSGRATGALVFVGYGITGKNEGYDDYAEADVAGKIVVLLRREPRQDDPDSPFAGKEVSSHAYINSKLQLAKLMKAAAVVMVNDPHSAPTAEKDELTPPEGFGTNSLEIPFFHIKTALLDQMLKDHPLQGDDGGQLHSVAEIEARIDQTLKPLTQPLTGWTCDAAAMFAKEEVDAFNVIGVLAGAGPLADETIVVGAHYDHLGMGGYGSLAPGRREIHNGADDNATGTAGMLDLARRFSSRAQKPSRRMVFIAFSGEERGLLGSSYYCEHPLFPLEKTIAMINFDMIGRLRQDRLTVFGVATGKGLPEIVTQAADGLGFDLNPLDHPFGGSDHLAFYNKQIPVLYPFTGVHNIYHTPEDDYNTINVPGAVRVVDFTERLLDGLQGLPKPPEFVRAQRRGRGNPRTAYLGIRPDYADTKDGLRLEGVTPDSPAAQAGLKTGDVVLRIDGRRIATAQEMIEFLRTKEPGDEIEIVVQRNAETKTVSLKLGSTS